MTAAVRPETGNGFVARMQRRHRHARSFAAAAATWMARSACGCADPGRALQADALCLIRRGGDQRSATVGIAGARMALQGFVAL